MAGKGWVGFSGSIVINVPRAELRLFFKPTEKIYGVFMGIFPVNDSKGW